MNETLEEFNKVLEDMELKSMDKAKIKSYAKDLYKAAYTLGQDENEEKKAETNKSDTETKKSIVELARSKRKIK